MTIEQKVEILWSVYVIGPGFLALGILLGVVACLWIGGRVKREKERARKSGI